MSPTDGTERAVQQVRESMNRVRGRLFGAIEAAGLPDRQTNALKGLVRQTTYDAQTEMEQTLREDR